MKRYFQIIFEISSDLIVFFKVSWKRYALKNSQFRDFLRYPFLVCVAVRWRYPPVNWIDHRKETRIQSGPLSFEAHDGNWKLIRNQANHPEFVDWESPLWQCEIGPRVVGGRAERDSAEMFKLRSKESCLGLENLSMKGMASQSDPTQVEVEKCKRRLTSNIEVS
jgi:hypothetical protein